MAMALKICGLAVVTALLATQADAADAKAGATVFNRCAICHSATRNGPNMIGPNLFGIVGHKAGTHAGYNYSGAMKAFGKTWTPALLDQYLTRPAQVVPGTKMAFAGISSANQRADLIAYLATLK